MVHFPILNCNIIGLAFHVKELCERVLRRNWFKQLPGEDVNTLLSEVIKEVPVSSLSEKVTNLTYGLPLGWSPVFN